MVAVAVGLAPEAVAVVEVVEVVAVVAVVAVMAVLAVWRAEAAVASGVVVGRASVAAGAAAAWSSHQR